MKSYSLILCLFIGSLLFAQKEKNVLDWIRSNAIAIPTEQISDSLFYANAPAIFKKATVYGFGESSHQHAENNTVRGGLLKTLVRYGNVKLFFIEESYGCAAMLDRYIQDGTGNANALLKNAQQAMNTTPEMLAMIEWLYTFNKTQTPNNKVHIYGMDCKFNYQLTPLLNDLLAYNNYSLTATEQAAITAVATFKGVQKGEDHQETIHTLKNLQHRIDSNADFKEKTNALLLLQAMLNYLEFRSTLSWGYRDQHMAGMVQAVLKLHPSKAVVWAHNEHISQLPQNNITLFGEETGTLVPSLGKHLKNVYANHYYAMGMEFGSGAIVGYDADKTRVVDTITAPLNFLAAATLYKVPMDCFYFDFSTAMTHRDMEKLITKKTSHLYVGGPGLLLKAMKYQCTQNAYATMYDGLIFIRQVSLTKGL
ncbi:erythromycin esterase family protein [Pustulibacterium marinum]|nr:erythromycin esterase family protein [Pustulibacterium marinum]